MSGRDVCPCGAKTETLDVFVMAVHPTDDPPGVVRVQHFCGPCLFGRVVALAANEPGAAA